MRIVPANPFTPHPGEVPRVVGGRSEELGMFGEAVVRAKGASGPIDHIVLLGEWGLGKTVLLKQFKAYAQTDGVPAFLCAISRFGSSASVIEGVRLLVDLMVRQSPLAAEIADEIRDLDSSVGSPATRGRRAAREIHPQVYLTSALLRIWPLLKSSLAVVLVDDAQNFPQTEAVLDVVRAALSDDEVRSRTNWLFVVSCMPSDWDYSLHKHHPIGRVFRRRRVLGMLSRQEVLDAVVASLAETGVAFDEEVLGLIYSATRGHPYELQTLCDNLYNSQLRGRVDRSQWEPSLELSLDQLGEAYFRAACSTVTPRELPVLRALASAAGPMSIKELQKQLVREGHGISYDDTKTYVYRLVKERQLVARFERGQYEVADRMLAEYVIRRLHPDDEED